MTAAARELLSPQYYLDILSDAAVASVRRMDPEAVLHPTGHFRGPVFELGGGEEGERLLMQME